MSLGRVGVQVEHPYTQEPEHQEEKPTFIVLIGHRQLLYHKKSPVAEEVTGQPQTTGENDELAKDTIPHNA